MRLAAYGLRNQPTPSPSCVRACVLSQGNGFISSEHLPSLVQSLPQWETPPLDELRGLVDPERSSLIVWDTFQRVMLPLHPTVGEHVRLQAEQERAQHFADDAAAAHSQSKPPD